MNYLMHGVTLALACFFAVNVALSAAVASTSLPARRSAPWLLWLRLLPAAAAALFVALVFVPSYWRFEPRELVEGFDVTLTLCAAAAAALLVSAFARGVAAWWSAVRMARAWIQRAEPIALDGVDIPAFQVQSREPFMALVGILRSRLLVTRGLIDALTPDELAASLAHEIAHHRGWDNLKRLAMRGAPDLLGWTRAARRLEREWAAAAELAADATASAATDRAGRLALASALVKVARLMPAATSFSEPISTLVDGGDIAARVRHLVDDAPAGLGRRSGWSTRVALAAAAAASLALVYSPILETVHRATEVLVNRLP